MNKKAHLPTSLTTVTVFSKALAVLLFFIFILAGAYFGMNYQHMLDVAMFSNVLTAPGQSTGTTTKTITLEDTGKTTYVHVGDMVAFQLGTVTQRWTLSFSSDVLKRITLGMADKIGQEGRYLVVQPGTVMVTGTGVANCPSGSMCPMYAMHFTTTIVAVK